MHFFFFFTFFAAVIRCAYAIIYRLCHNEWRFRELWLFFNGMASHMIIIVISMGYRIGGTIMFTQVSRDTHHVQTDDIVFLKFFLRLFG